MLLKMWLCISCHQNMESSSPLLESWLATRLLWSTEAAGIKECQLQTQASKGFHLLSKGPAQPPWEQAPDQPALWQNRHSPDTFSAPSDSQLHQICKWGHRKPVSPSQQTSWPQTHKQVQVSSSKLGPDQQNHPTNIYRVTSNNKHLLFQATGFGCGLLCSNS